MFDRETYYDVSIDLSLLPGLPPASPLAGTDVMLIGRPPPAGSAPGTPMIPYAILLSTLAAAISAGLPSGGSSGGSGGGVVELPNVYLAATGVDQASAAVLVASQVNFINAGSADTGVRPPQGADASYTIFNALTMAQALYPPLAVGGVPRTINGLAAVSILPGEEIVLRTVDGVAFFVAV